MRELTIAAPPKPDIVGVTAYDPGERDFCLIAFKLLSKPNLNLPMYGRTDIKRQSLRRAAPKTTETLERKSEVANRNRNFASWAIKSYDSPRKGLGKSIHTKRKAGAQGDSKSLAKPGR